jgi:hypothetical protein
MKGTTVNELMKSAFDNLEVFHVSEMTKIQRSSRSANVEATYSAIKTQFQSENSNEDASRSIRIVPLQLSAENLAAFMGERDLCWLIEDFHKVDAQEKTKLAQLMKVFMDCAAEYPTVKIIATGAVETARQVVEYDPEMRNRVSEIEVNLMTEKEIISIIDKGMSLLNIRLSKSAKQGIAKYSSGLGAVCHQLCLNIFNSLFLYETAPDLITVDSEHFERAIANYVAECSDTIKSNFEKARKLKRKSEVQHADIILDALCDFDNEGVDRFRLLGKINNQTPSYTDINLKKQLASLATVNRGELIRLNENSGLYSFSNPIYRAYALTLFHKKTSNSNNGLQTEYRSIIDIVRLLEKELESLSAKITGKSQRAH